LKSCRSFDTTWRRQENEQWQLDLILAPMKPKGCLQVRYKTRIHKQKSSNSNSRANKRKKLKVY